MSAPVYQWQPSTAEIARRAGIAPEDVIRFDHNTSPVAPPWAEEVALAASARLNEYPAADYRPLCEAAAGYAGVDVDQVVPGAGADELIALTARAFLPAGGTAVAADPTYPLYRIATAHQAGRFVPVARTAPDFAIPAGLAAAAATADLVWMCVPHNPSGRRDPDGAIAAVIEAASGIVLIDAAYAQFAGDSWTAWVKRYPNLVVAHTMSKAFGLAGIRVGYSVSVPELANRLQAVRPPGSISTVSAELAVRALGEPETAAANVAAITRERDRLAGGLAVFGFRVLPSMTNFVLCEVGASALDIEQRLMAEGLVVRSYRTGPLKDYLRFTVRLPDEDDRLLAALRVMLPR